MFWMNDYEDMDRKDCWRRLHLHDERLDQHQAYFDFPALGMQDDFADSASNYVSLKHLVKPT